MNGSLTITVTGPWFYSAGDEDAFFSWLNSVASVWAVGGVGTDLEITLASRRLSQRDLREILAIFHRYALDKRVLKQFDRARLAWFRDPKAYWYTDVFGTRPPSAKGP